MPPRQYTRGDRQTGYTSKLLIWAVGQMLDGEHVRIIVHEQRYAYDLLHRLWRVCDALGVPSVTNHPQYIIRRDAEHTGSTEVRPFSWIADGNAYRGLPYKETRVDNSLDYWRDYSPRAMAEFFSYNEHCKSITKKRGT